MVREGDQPRALLTAEGPEHRLILIPLDDRSEMRIDGDALAIWLAQGSLQPPLTSPGAPLAGWASAIGLLLVLVVVAFAILGSFTFFGWLFTSLGWIR